MKIELTHETVYSFPGPNLLFSGSQSDFNLLSDIFYQLMHGKLKAISITEALSNTIPSDLRISFESTKEDNLFAVIKAANNITFKLNEEVWKVLYTTANTLASQRGEFYLISGEWQLEDFDMKQDCNVIWTTTIL